ncbi:hypothetical protein Q5752_000003 [Cryptotrichosporon argae]
MSSLAKRTSRTSQQPSYKSGSIHHGLGAGSLEYIIEEAENGGGETYQEATGAPVERKSPLGLGASWVVILSLNINQMIGTGVFSTPSTILKNVGSVGLSLIFWVIGFLIAYAGMAIYLELASYFPSRSGSEAVYLEQAYPRPRYFFPVTFAVQSVLLSFSASNAIVLAQYLYKVAGHTATPWEQKGVAVAGYTLAVLLVIASNRLAYWVSNVTGFIKLATLVFISITGLVVLGGHTAVADPTANFHDAFAGTTSSGYGIANALYKVTFAYAGYANCFNVTAEVKDPIKTMKWSAPLSVTVVAILYLLCNVAYFAASTKASLEASAQTAASLFFTNVFGTSAARGLNFLVVVSAFGNLVGVLIGQSRLLREVGRQGTLPYPRAWASTWPFGTPLAPYLLKWGMTMLMILAPPAGDAFNFVVDLSIYPSSLFLLLMAFGLFLIRRQRARLGLARAGYRAWTAAVVFFLAVQVFLLVMPWYPPLGGAHGGDVSFWYATYCAVGLGIIVFCAFYYWVWIWVLPRVGMYQMRQTVLVLAGGEVTHALVKVPNAEVEQWDATHDGAGNEIGAGVAVDEYKQV